MQPILTTLDEIEYPESDGEPMGETDLHIDWLFRLRDMLKQRYRDQQVYVAADLLLYYEEGVPWSYIVPDVFVVKDCDPKMRRIYKLWEEPRAPHVAFELTSLSSKRRDTSYKPRVYAQIGVREYFLYDPYGEYLSPPLQGYRLEGEEYHHIEPDSEGQLTSVELDFTLRLDGDGGLVLVDAVTGKQLITSNEAAAQAEAAAAQAEAAARRAEAEVERLRRLLDERSHPE